MLKSKTTHIKPQKTTKTKKTKSRHKLTTTAPTTQQKRHFTPAFTDKTQKKKITGLFQDPAHLEHTGTDSYPFVSPHWLAKQFVANDAEQAFVPKNKHLKVLTLFPQESQNDLVPPGAVFFDMNAFNTAHYHGKPNTMPTPAEWELAMARAGVQRDDDVVVVDQPGCLSAARFWYMSIANGVNPGKIRVLQGGNQCFSLGAGMYWDASTHDTLAKAQRTAQEYESTRGEADHYLKHNPQTFTTYAADNEYVFSVIEQHAKNAAVGRTDHFLPLYIDTRPQHMFTMGHPVSAVNVPYPTLIKPMQLDGEEFIDRQPVGTTLLEKKKYWGNVLDNMIAARQAQNAANNNTNPVVSPTQPLEIIFGCQTATTASTGFMSLWNYVTTTQNPQHQLGNVLIQIFDPSWFVYGNKSIDVPGVKNSCSRRYFQVGQDSPYNDLLKQ